MEPLLQIESGTQDISPILPTQARMESSSMGLADRMFPDSIDIPATLPALVDTAMVVDAAPHCELKSWIWLVT